MAKNLFLGWVISFGLISSLCAQENASFNFEGLKRTQESYLIQFIHSMINTSPSDSLLNSNVQRLKNIASIGNASYRKDTTSQGIKITYEVEEVKTLLPIFNFGGIEGNVWFQVGFSDINWLGKGQFLSAAYQNNDRRHSGNVFYKIPRINNTNWGFSASLNKWSSREPVFFPEGTVNYDYDNNGISLSIIRNLNLNSNVELGGTYFVENYTKSEFQFLEDPPGPLGFRQPKWLAKTAYSVDRVNYHYFYLEGFAWSGVLQGVYNTLDDDWFLSAQFQARYYARHGEKGNFASRLRIGVASNDDTPFAPFVADSHTNIRGIGNRIDRGTAQVILNTEYRHTIRENKKWGAQIIAFSDTGTWRNPGGQLKDLVNPSQFRQFIGGGFRVIYNKVFGAIFRVDYGIDIFNKDQKGLVIGFGQYF